MTFDWLAPKEDGGLPVTSYSIMKSENDGDWVKLDTVDKKTTSYKARNLSEGSRYNFRVMAVNKLGEGKPLDSDTAFIKKPAGKLKILLLFYLFNCVSLIELFTSLLLHVLKWLII